MVVGPDRGRPHLSQQLPKTLIRREAQTNWHRVDEEADQLLEIRMVAAPDRNADREVVLAAVAMQQQGHQRQQPHLQGGALLAAERLEGLQQRRFDREANASPPVRGHRWPGPIAGQLQRFQIPQLLNPVVLQLNEPLTAQPLSLPDGVVLVMNGKRLKLR